LLGHKWTCFTIYLFKRVKKVTNEVSLFCKPSLLFWYLNSLFISHCYLPIPFVPYVSHTLSLSLTSLVQTANIPRGV
jgi:hypothetical protein